MKTTLTGASGFVGQNLTQYLQQQNIEVETLSLRNNWKYRFNPSTKAIIHLAGKAHDTSNTSEEEEYFKINRDLTIELFQEFCNSDIEDFFFFSSVKAAADTVKGILQEDIIPNPQTPYGKSKLEAETVLLNQTLPQGKRLFIIRPCMIHGPGNKGNLNLLYNVVKKGIPWPLAAFENKRSFISIENLCFLILQMLKNKEIASGIYNFADDEPLATNDLIQIMAKSTGKKTHLWKIAPQWIHAIAQIGNTLKLPLNTERLKKLTESYVVSNEKIKKALHLQTLPQTAQQGLEKTIQSFSSQARHQK